MPYAVLWSMWSATVFKNGLKYVEREQLIHMH